MKRIAIVLWLMVGLNALGLYADSPLTSTPFWKAYSSEPMIKYALKSKGKISSKFIRFLTSNEIAIAQKLCTINALGWQQDGKNAQKFQNSLMKKYSVNSTSELLNKITPDHLICLAYLKANDNYFNVSIAADWASIALTKDQSNSFALHIVAALILAQMDFDTDW